MWGVPVRPKRGRNVKGDLYVHNGTVGMAANNDRFRIPFRIGRARVIASESILGYLDLGFRG